MPSILESMLGDAEKVEVTRETLNELLLSFREELLMELRSNARVAVNKENGCIDVRIGPQNEVTFSITADILKHVVKDKQLESSSIIIARM